VIEPDRKLLARVARVNTQLGAAVLELLDGSELPAAGVRELGQHLAGLAADLLARAEELDGRAVDRVIIDARP
jgi:hypothetical protein